MTESSQRFDLNAIRARLRQTEGKAYWRSLEELAGTEAFQTFVQREFPQGASELTNPVSRRRFLKLAAASLGLAGLTACVGQPAEKILPYVTQPEELVPGKPRFFATAHLLGGFAEGVLAESHMGRPTKIEGNPDHPASLGASDPFAQASVLTLYDPDRAQVVTGNGRIRTWDQFFLELTAAVNDQEAEGGAGLRILTPTITSPTLAAQRQGLLETYPRARWHQYDPVNWDNAYEGARLAFGQVVQARYDFSQADVILALDADFMSTFPGRLRYIRDFSQKRMVSREQTAMNRLYVAESTPTITGSMADHRWPQRPEQTESLGRAVAGGLGVEVDGGGSLPSAVAGRVEALVADLQAHQGSSLVLAGMAQPPVVHALAHAINDALGNVGRTVTYTEPVQVDPTAQTESLPELVQAMDDGQVELLIILEGNPAYRAPADLNFDEALANVELSGYLGLYEDETAALCDWHLPMAHPLETWGDARAYDGSATIMQPVIEPLYAGRSAPELLAAVLRTQGRSPYDIVRQFWQEQLPEDSNFETLWRQALHDGVVPETQLPPQDVVLQADFTAAGSVSQQSNGDDQELVAIFRPDPSIWDGRFNNNGWLQELPKPFTKLTWDNAALISPATAERLDLANEEVVTLRYQDRTVRAPVWILPGQADGCVTLHLGYGRTRTGRVGSGAGFNAYQLRTTDAPWFARGLQIEKTGTTTNLASTQDHHWMEGRNLVRTGTLAQFEENPDFVHQVEEELPSLYPEYEYDGYAWGMSINLNTCVGCNACVVACQAENNIPIVGKEGVGNGREMHWIRVDGYFKGNDLDDPRLLHQPVPCMHCEKAPCEVVCPVAATTHSAEGLNEMTYNRCVGTRYCSNNCPYKVRRFNFLEYSQPDVPVLNLLSNPDVTVRSRGVMEKCTYCVQRINQARSTAQQEGRSIRDGELMTACQQACPAQAIVFGDISDPDTQVAQLKAQPHDYGLLAELGTRPRTTYLARLWNLNPEIETEGDDG